jgi:S-adenosylhomocysteine hydrolase
VAIRKTPNATRALQPTGQVGPGADPSVRPADKPATPVPVAPPQAPPSEKAAQFDADAPAAAPKTVAPAPPSEPVAGTSFRGHALRAQKGPADAAPPLTSKERLMALVRPPEVDPSAPPPPSPKALKRMVQDKVGHHARRLSADEIALVLGQPGWSDAVRSLGTRYARQDSAKSRHFLLAAHLARWMDGIYEGASVDDVVQSYKAAHPQNAERFDYLDGELVRLLQKAFPFMPAWDVKPAQEKAATGAEAWLAEPTDKDLYAERLENALGQLAEVPITMKLTHQVGQELAKDQRFAGHNVVMVQHMLGQANPLVDAMVEAGMEVDKAEYVGVPYQNNPSVQVTLERKFGLDVTVPERGNIDSMWEHVCASVDRAYERHLENGEPILILDDGGYASKYINEKYKDKQHLFKVVEQTTRGLTEIDKLDDPQFPILNVAGSFGKRFESAQVGDAVVQAIRNVLDNLTTTPARKDVLIVGAGKVGVGVAEAFKGDGARVSIFDPYLSAARKKELRAMGFRVFDKKEDALKEKFLTVGASGHRSIDMTDFAKMSSPTFIASSSSKRVEIDILGLQQESTVGGVVRRIEATRVNEQTTFHYWTKDNKIVTAMADTLPVNFQDVNSIAPELIDHTMALMLLGAGEAVKSDGKGLVELDETEQFKLQAAMEGLNTEPQHDGEVGHKIGDTTFYGTPHRWLEVARSAATPPAVLDTLYRQDVDTDPMSELCLAVVGSNHEFGDETVDDILARGNLAHISRLLENEYLTKPQHDKVTEFLWGAYVDIAGFGGKSQGFGERATAVTRAPDGGHHYVSPRGVMHDHVIVHTANDRDLLLSQLSQVLFQHPSAPDHLFTNALKDTYRHFQFRDGANASSVQLLSNPRWTTEQLEQMSRNIIEAAYSGLSMSSKPKYADYARDLLETLRDHPSASREISELADFHIGQVNERIVQSKGREARLPQGREAWPVSTLGLRAPTYL